MTRTLLTGATGTLGEALRPRLRDAGHEVVGTSRSPPDEDGEWVTMDLSEGTGVEAAVEDVDAVVHAATDPMGDPEAVDVEGTRRLLEAAEDADVSNFVYVSIVGIDDIPWSYYQHKLTAEGLVQDSDVPGTIVRATQFHEFVDEFLGMVSRLPLLPVPTKFKVQPIAAAELAETIVEEGMPEAAGRVSDLVGPEVLTGRQIANTYREARGLRRPVVRLPIPGKTASAFRSGAATQPDRAGGTVTWEDWVTDHYA